MLFDHQALLDALQIALEPFEGMTDRIENGFGDSVEVPALTPTGPFTAALYRCTKLLFEAPLCTAALGDEF